MVFMLFCGYEYPVISKAAGMAERAVRFAT